MQERILTIENLRLSFPVFQGEVSVLNDVSLHINRGEIVGVVGESGSGKSVTAMLTMRLIPQNSYQINSGKLEVLGKDVLHAAESDMREMRGNKVAMIFQEPMTALNPTRRIGKQMVDVIRQHRPLNVKQARKRAAELLSDMQIADPVNVMDRYPFELSGGMRQRVMIAMALAGEPSLIIADEPTTALDVTIQAEILALLKDLQRRLGMALVFITHDLGIVRRIADRVVVMQGGGIVETGATADIFRAATHPYTRALLAAEPTGRKEAVASSAPVILSGRDVRIVFHLSRGFLGARSLALTAVDGVSLSLRKGPTIGIVGESGSGKSTSAKVLIGLEKPTSGQVVFGGEPVRSFTPAVRKRLGRILSVVFQDPATALNARMTVRDALLDPLQVHRLGTAASRSRKVRDLIGLVGLPASALDALPSQLSGGQRQRVAIARALVLDPQVIVADEPTSALDVSVRAQILNLLTDLKEQLGLGMVFISHDIQTVRYLSDEIAVMNRGRVVEFGDAARVFDDPADDYTRTLLGAAPSLLDPHH